MRCPASVSRRFSELKQITTVVESSLKDLFKYDKINYLMLMMVDPDVHFHILPRYSATRVFGQAEFTDPGWPGPPDLGKTNQVDDYVDRSSCGKHLEIGSAILKWIRPKAR